MKAAQVPKAGGEFQIVEREIPGRSEAGSHQGAGLRRLPQRRAHEGRHLARHPVSAGSRTRSRGRHRRAGRRRLRVEEGPARRRRLARRPRRHLPVLPARRLSQLPEPARFPASATTADTSEYMVAPAEALAAIPEALTRVDAAPLLCAGITTFNALRHSGAMPGDLVAVLGIGGLGHLGIQFANKFGYRVAAIGRGPENAALAKKLGAQHLHRQPGDERRRGVAEAGRRAGDPGDGAELEGDVRADRRPGAERQADGGRRGARAHRGHAGHSSSREPDAFKAGPRERPPTPRTRCGSPS